MSYENEPLRGFQRRSSHNKKQSKKFKACHGNWYVNISLPLLRKKDL